MFLHRVFKRSLPSMDSQVKNFIRRLMYLHRSDTEDVISLMNFDVMELILKMNEWEIPASHYYIEILGSKCIVFLYNRQKNLYERIQKRFIETSNLFLQEDTDSPKPNIRKWIHGSLYEGDHWKEDKVYNYTKVYTS